MSRQYYAIQNYKKQIAELKAKLKKENKMIVEKSSIIKVTLSMSEEEASWLQSVCQNPLNCITAEEEDEDDKAFRHEFFNALTEAGVRR